VSYTLHEVVPPDQSTLSTIGTDI